MVLRQHPQEKEMDLQPREVMVQTQRDLELSLKKYKWSVPQDMTSFANDNSERYIPEKDSQEAIVIKTPRPKNFDPVKKLDGYLQEILKQTKRPQDIAIDNILGNAQDKVLDIMGPLPKLWLWLNK